MAQEDINKDLGHYIKEKNKKEHFWKKFKPQHKVNEEEIEEKIKEELREAETNENISPEDKKELEKMEHQVEEVNEVEEKVEEEIDEEREGILKRFFKKLNFSKKGKDDDHDMSDIDLTGEDDDEETEEHSETTVGHESTGDEEMKEFLKSMHTWITKLEPEVQKDFKNSKDFEKYTEMLRKHGLIK